RRVVARLMAVAVTNRLQTLRPGAQARVSFELGSGVGDEGVEEPEALRRTEIHDAGLRPEQVVAAGGELVVDPGGERLHPAAEPVEVALDGREVERVDTHSAPVVDKRIEEIRSPVAPGGVAQLHDIDGESRHPRRKGVVQEPPAGREEGRLRKSRFQQLEDQLRVAVYVGADLEDRSAPIPASERKLLRARRKRVDAHGLPARALAAERTTHGLGERWQIVVVKDEFSEHPFTLGSAAPAYPRASLPLTRHRLRGVLE